MKSLGTLFKRRETGLVRNTSFYEEVTAAERLAGETDACCNQVSS